MKEKRIYLLGGPGGVGKTTCAAALGMHLATQGHRTLVLTVDPAKRLAQALGFSKFSFEIEQVPLPDPGQMLFASMLDSDHYFDKVIGRFAKSSEQREKILRNPLYRTMVESLGGTHEYAAMERLLEFAKDTRFDKIVVDTPPTQNAVELFSAPMRLANFMDNSVLKWFQGESPRYLQWFRQGTRLAMKFLEKVFGGDFLQNFSVFLNDLDGLQAGFRSRHLEVMELLRGPDVAFWLVTLASETRHFESAAFAKTLAEFGLKLDRLILNRMEPPLPKSPPTQPDLLRLREVEISILKKQTFWHERFSQTFEGHEIVLLPRVGFGISDRAALVELGKQIS